MSQGPFQRRVSSRPATDFAGALAHGGTGSAVANIPIPGGNLHTGFNIRNVLIESMQNFDMKLHLFSTAAGAAAATPGASTWLGYIAVYAAQALRISNTGLYYFQWADVFQRYVDDDASNAVGDTPWNIHAVLVNADAATDKSAGAPGALKVDFILEGTGV